MIPDPHPPIIENQSKKTIFLLWVLCIIGSWCVIPYIYYLGLIPPNVTLLHLLFISTLQTALIYGIACYASYKALPQTDLQPFAVSDSVQQVLLPGVLSGLILSSVIYLIDRFGFGNSVHAITQPPLLIQLLASLYGAINEEVLLRLFLFTSIYFILRRVFKVTETLPKGLLWTVNIITAVLFGLGHLPAAMTLFTPAPEQIFRILLLNGIPGLVFGWLYWTRSLWTAMTAHLVTDVMLRMFLFAF